MKPTRKIPPRLQPARVAALAGMAAMILTAQAAAPSLLSAQVLIPASASPTPDPGPPAETRIFPLAEIRKGQTGVAYTVFEGVLPEPMQVEILGVLKNSIGPGQDMILARLHGPKPEYTGVVAGMSGSPVYIGGRLAGALSYRIGQFSKEPIAGITPIQQMFEVRDRGSDSPMRASASENSPASDLKPIETPLVFSGFSPETLDRFGDRFRALGLTPVAGLGGSDPDAKQPEPIIPGSAVSAVLVQGDMSAAATCTVTYVDRTRLLACGHPFTQYGAVDIPMTKTNVVATLPSPLNAFKIVNATETVGSFTEDRSSAILGVFGRKARMIPVTVEVTGADANPPGRGPRRSGGLPAHTFHFEVLDNPALTPNTMLVTVYQSLHGTNRSGEETSYRVTGSLGVQGFPSVRLNSLLAPSDFLPAAVNVALYINESFSRIYGNAANPTGKPILTGLHLQVSAIPDRRTALLESASLSRTEAHPGDTVEVLATIHPFQGPARTLRIPVHLPESLAPGPTRLVVADAATLDRLTEPASRAPEHSLADTISSLNRLHPNDRIFCALLDHAPQAMLESGALPGLPLSMANVFEPLKQSQKMQLNGESVLSSSSEEVGYALSGSVVLTLLIR